MHTSRTRGFTLIELLIVIAIIGILSAVAVAWLSSKRQDARAATALSTLKSAHSVATICADQDSDLLPAPPGMATAGVDSICASEQTWPELPQGWSYIAHPDPDVSDASFEFRAQSVNGEIARCDISQCEIL